MLSDTSGDAIKLDDAVIHWSPLALLSRTVSVRELSADHLTVLKRPELVRGPDRESSSGSAPFVRNVMLEKLSIGTLTVDAGVAGRAAAFAIEGRGHIRQSNGEIILDVTPAEEGVDRLATNLRWSEGQLLNGELDLLLPANGVFVQLAGLPNDTDLSARFVGNGGLNAWSAIGEVMLNDERVFDLSGSHEDEVIALNAEILTEPLAVFSQQVSRLPSLLTVETRLETQTAENMPATLSVRGEGLLSSLNTVLPSWRSPRPESIEADFRIDDVARLVPELPMSVADVQVSLNGIVLDGLELSGEGRLSVSGIDHSQIAVEALSGPFRYSVSRDRQSLTADLRTSGVVADQDIITDLIGSSQTLSISADYSVDDKLITISNARLSGGGQTLTATGTIKTEQPEFDPGRMGAFPNRYFFEVSVDGQSLGKATSEWVDRVTGTVRLGGDQYGLGISPNLLITPGTAVPTSLQVFTSEPVRLIGAGEITGAGFRFEDAILIAEPFQAKSYVSGGLNGKDFDIFTNFRITEWPEFGLNGLRGSLKLNGENGEIAGSVTGSLIGLNYAGLDGEAILYGAEFERNEDGDFSGSLGISEGILNSQALVSSLDFSLNDDQTQLRDIDLNWGELTGSGDLAFTSFDLAGLSGDIRLEGRPPINALPFETIDAELSASEGQLEGGADLVGLSLGGAEFETARLELDGAPDAFDYALRLAGLRELMALEQPVSLTADGTVSRAGGDTTILTEAQGAFGPLSLSTRKPSQLTLNEAGLSLVGQLAIADGEVDFSITPEGLARRIEAEVRGVNLQPFYALTGRDNLEGSAAGTINVALPENNIASGRASLNLSGLGIAGVDRPDLTLSLDSALSSDEAAFDLSLFGIDGLDVTGTARLPVRSDNYDFSGLSIDADGSGPLRTLWAFFGPPGTRLVGNFNISAGATGGVGLEQSTAELSIQDATFEHGELGLFLENIDLNAALTSGNLTINQFTANGRDGGNLQVSGEQVIGGDGNIVARFNELVAVKRRGLLAKVSGDLSYSASGDEKGIEGDLTVEDALIDLAALNFASTPPTLDVTFEDGPESVVETGQADPTPTRLDVSLTAPRRLKITGQGVNAELELNARFTGDLANPKYDATAEFVRGTLSFLGKTFDFTDGRITVPGSIDDARVDLTAERETETLTAVVRVSGPATRPDIRLSSTPQLPEDEVLSRVLFGRSPSQLSGLEAAQLAAALAQLAGGGTGFNLAGTLSDAVGLDRLDIASSETGEARVTTGKYLAEDVYLEVETTGSGAPGVVVEWTPLDNVEVETEIDPIEGPKVSVDWTRDYD